ncbi:hypothetical protein EYF80_019036 [Liparis tanakae]|uniref:Uncharacterized protein n=1 Tax=Liparis tanakae TaxID=230148 RepID=A0A4Z2I0J3_9TELE|nr:hypothetical protein EYF80_019036 [Liparis tanakae]
MAAKRASATAHFTGPGSSPKDRSSPDESDQPEVQAVSGCPARSDEKLGDKLTNLHQVAAYPVLAEQDEERLFTPKYVTKPGKQSEPDNRCPENRLHEGECGGDGQDNPSPPPPSSSTPIACRRAPCT